MSTTSMADERYNLKPLTFTTCVMVAVTTVKFDSRLGNMVTLTTDRDHSCH